MDSDDPPLQTIRDILVLLFAVVFSVAVYFYASNLADEKLQPDPIPLEVIGVEYYRFGTMEQLTSIIRIGVKSRVLRPQ